MLEFFFEENLLVGNNGRQKFNKDFCEWNKGKSWKRLKSQYLTVHENFQKD